MSLLLASQGAAEETKREFDEVLRQVTIGRRDQEILQELQVQPQQDSDRNFILKMINFFRIFKGLK